jgi:hypothetical protein
MFRVEDHQHTPVGAEPTALEVGQQVLTHPRVLGRAVPHAERVFLAVSRDAERHDQAGLADMDSSINSPTRSIASSEAVCHAANGAPVFVTKRRLSALAGAPAAHRRRHRLQAPRIPPRGDAHEHLLDHASIQRIDVGHGLKCRQRHLPALCPHARSPHGHLASAQHHFAAHGAGDARRSVSCA